MDLKLFTAPGSCSRVSLIALEEIGVPFTTETVFFTRGQHRSPEYLALNPPGKVPLLLINGRPLAQTAAILTWLARTFPDAGLLPAERPAVARALARETAAQAELDAAGAGFAFPPAPPIALP